MLGGLDGWEQGLREAGIDAVSGLPSDGSLDLVAAPSALRAAAAGSGAEAIVIEGRTGSRTLARAGYRVRRFLTIPEVGDAEVFVPLDDPVAARYAIARALPIRGGLKTVRNNVVGALVVHGALPPVRPFVITGEHAPGPPFLVAAAAELGIPADVGWFVTLGQRGDDARRGCFFLFPRGCHWPEWVVKFSRLPGDRTPFDGDERGVARAREAGSPVIAHAPQIIGRLDVAEIAASVERAALGERLDRFLDSRATRAEKLVAVELVAAWIVEFARHTSRPVTASDPRRWKNADDVVPRWFPAEERSSLVNKLAAVPAVLQHGDLTTGNVMIEGTDFTALDWTGARLDGFPLWDLLHFVADALAHVDGVAYAQPERDAYSTRLFRGEVESSRLLFRWLDSAARTSGLDGETVGALTMAHWLCVAMHALTPGEPLPSVGSVRHSVLPAPARMASLWLSTPGLGSGWTAWQT